MKTTCGIYTHYFKDFKRMSAIDGGWIRRQYMCLKKNRDAAGPQRLLFISKETQSIWRECPLGFILVSQKFVMGFNLDLIFFLTWNTK